MLHTRASASPIQGAGSLFTSLTTISRHAGPLRQPNSARQTPQAVAAAAAALNSAASQSLPCQQPHTAASTAPVQLDPEAKARHKRPAGWKAPGPPPAVACVAVELQPNETLSYLTGDWRILQLRNGHRWVGGWLAGWWNTSLSALKVCVVCLLSSGSTAHTHL